MEKNCLNLVNLLKTILISIEMVHRLNNKANYLINF